MSFKKRHFQLDLSRSQLIGCFRIQNHGSKKDPILKRKRVIHVIQSCALRSQKDPVLFNRNRVILFLHSPLLIEYLRTV